jgi:XRE family transcriptional regulator, aerobic/anaerobic benzoate catabolism transcriptional regulator
MQNLLVAAARLGAKARVNLVGNHLSASPEREQLSTEERSPILDAFADRLRALRAQRGITRKALAEAASVSERYLGNLEAGRGNPTLLILHDVARGLRCSVAELLGDVTASSPEWLMIRDLLKGCSEDDLRRARAALSGVMGVQGTRNGSTRRIALIGLRGAGKSTLGQLLSEELDVPFVELSAEIERVAGLSIREIYNLYGTNAYRRYERRALDDILQTYSEAVIASPGGMVSEPATFNLLLSNCLTVWLRASPEDHMQRVVRQGDMRPMAGNAEAMTDLRQILDARSSFYAKADVTLDTSSQSLDETFALLSSRVRATLGAAI